MLDQRAVVAGFLSQQIELTLQKYFLISLADALTALALQEDAVHIFLRLKNNGYSWCRVLVHPRRICALL
ncbi:hypothetical protein [Gluconobacter potus]|uniref:hypothetical protein n=1 Tax=Gluconobacter potus TaxID=2724927 RepID=UPI0039E80D1C